VSIARKYIGNSPVTFATHKGFAVLLCKLLMGETNYQMLKVLLFLRSGEGLTSSNKDNSANFSGEKSTMKHSGVSTFLQYAKNFKSNLASSNLKESKVPFT